MIKHLCSVFVIWFLAITSVQAQIYIRDYTYKASDADSKITSRANALDQVKVILLQEIGTHIRQKINISKDSSGNSYASEDVEAITAGLTKVDILEEKWNGETYYLKASIDADTERVLNALEEFKKDKSEESQKQLEQFKENQHALKTAREEIAQLKIQLNHTNNATEKEKIVVKYIEKVNQMSSIEMVVKGIDYQSEGRYEDAVYWFRKAAEHGNILGQNNLGQMYLNGRGVKQNDAQAAHWYRKAVEQGSELGQILLGFMYEHGRGVVQDPVEAARLYRKAAEQGVDIARVYLANIYKSGPGVKQNDAQAAHWYREAAEQGVDTAQVYLGNMYKSGRGVKQDDAQAVHWYREAAEQGYAFGQSNLGLMYGTGRGVKRDYVQAVHWFRKAAEKGNAFAQGALGNMYETGRGVKQDYVQAVHWYRKAAEKGNASAQYSLGFMYGTGRGVKRDYVQAAHWYRKAAKKGVASAQNSLAWGYASCKFGCEGDKAVYWAKRLLSTPGTLKNSGKLDTVAAAYARANKFDEAIDYQKKAIALLTKKEETADYTSRLSLYKKGKPYTEKQ